MRTAIICGALAALTVATASAVEDRSSANFMLPLCKIALTDQADRSFLAGMCVGSISGIASMFVMLQHRDSKLCADMPDGVTPGQMILVVVRYIEARPKDMHEPFDGLAALALMDAWPCKK
jgi:hypothetical protein